MPDIVYSDDFDSIDHGITGQMVAEFSQGMVDSVTVGLEQRIDSVVSNIRTYAGWHIFKIATTRSRLDGPQSNLLQLPSLHVRAIESLTELGKEIPADQYDWSSRGQVAKISHCDQFTGRLGSIVVDFEHGYPKCPSDLFSVIAAMVIRGASSPVPGRTSYTVGQRSESYASVSGNFGDVVPFADEYRVLNMYKLPPYSGFN